MQKSNLNKVKKLSHFKINNKSLINYVLILILLLAFILINLSIFQLLCIDGSSLIWFKILPFLNEKFQDIIDSSFYSFIDNKDLYPTRDREYINEVKEAIMRKSPQVLGKTKSTTNYLYPHQLHINTKQFIRALWNMNLMEYPDMYVETPIVIHFDAYIEQPNVTFIPLQSKLFVVPEEPMLAFFRLENNSTEPLYLTSVYSVFPNEVIPHVLKLQCFCYENVFLQPGESVNLPILFSISDELLEVYKTKTNSINICIQYTLLAKH
jgi:hypothetical protein